MQNKLSKLHMCSRARKAQEEEEIMEGLKGASGGEVGTEVLNTVVRTGGFNKKMAFKPSPEAVEVGRPSDVHLATCSEGPHFGIHALPSQS